MIQRRKHLQHKVTEYQLKNRCFSLRNPGLASGQNFTLTIRPKHTVYNMEYSIDGINWTVLNNVVPIPNLRRVYVRVRNGYEYNDSTPSSWEGINFQISSASDPGLSDSRYDLFNGNHFRPKGVELSGNILTLIYGTSNMGTINDKKDLIPDECFKELFMEGPLLDAEKLLLPTTDVPFECYYDMFALSGVLTPPIIKAKTVNSYGMAYMFSQSSLVRPPLLQVTYCYDYGMSNMFAQCDNLTIGFKDPYVLPIGVTSYACINMFNSCGFVFQTPFMPAANVAMGSYNNMFDTCDRLNVILSNTISYNASAGGNNRTWLTNAVKDMVRYTSSNVTSDDSNAYYTFGQYSGYQITSNYGLPENFFSNSYATWNQIKANSTGAIWSQVSKSDVILNQDFTDYRVYDSACAESGEWNPRNPVACAKCMIKHYVFSPDIVWPTWDGEPAIEAWGDLPNLPR